MDMCTSHLDARPTIDELWRWLCEVPDPEIPVVSVVDLGIVRDIAWSESDPDECMVAVTPTYSGCPATAVISDMIREALHGHGVKQVRIQVRLSPPWTTDWMTSRARENLRDYGIAPPVGRASTQSQGMSEGLCMLGQNTSLGVIACPRCSSSNTQMVSQFGSTPCKSLYRCLACQEPFDYFKCH